MYYVLMYLKYLFACRNICGNVSDRFNSSTFQPYRLLMYVKLSEHYKINALKRRKPCSEDHYIPPFPSTGHTVVVHDIPDFVFAAGVVSTCEIFGKIAFARRSYARITIGVNLFLRCESKLSKIAGKSTGGKDYDL